MLQESRRAEKGAGMESARGAPVLGAREFAPAPTEPVDANYPYLTAAAAASTGNMPQYPDPRSNAQGPPATGPVDVISSASGRGGFPFRASNRDCLVCRRPVDENRSLPIVYVQGCAHVYHAACGTQFMFAGPKRDCPECGEGFDANDDACIEAVPEMSDPVFRRLIENRFGKLSGPADDSYSDDDDAEEGDEDYDESHWKSKYGDRQLSVVQKARLFGGKWKARLKSGIKDKMTLDDLLENDRTMDDLIEMNISLLDMYFSIGIQTWKDLVSLGLKKKHLTEKQGDLVPLEQLVDLYYVSYEDLFEDLSFRIVDAINMNFEAHEMHRLSVSVDSLVDRGLDTKKLLRFGYSLDDWIKLGLEKRHLIAMRFGLEDLKQSRWNPVAVVQRLRLNTLERAQIGVAAYLQEVKRAADARRGRAASRSGGSRQQQQQHQQESGSIYDDDDRDSKEYRRDAQRRSRNAQRYQRTQARGYSSAYDSTARNSQKGRSTRTGGRGQTVLSLG